MIKSSCSIYKINQDVEAFTQPTRQPVCSGGPEDLPMLPDVNGITYLTFIQ